MNELIFLIIIVICIVGLLSFYKYMGHDGLYLWIALATIFSFIASFRTTPLYGFDVNCAFPILTSIYLSIYILIEKYNKKETKQIISISVFISIIFAIFLVIAYRYNPSIYNNSSIYITKLINNNYLNLITFPIILGISEYATIIVYKFIKEYYNNTFVKNCLSAIVISLIDTFIYLFIIYIGNKNIPNFLNIILATFTFKLMVSIIYLPLMYYVENAKKVLK